GACKRRDELADRFRTDELRHRHVVIHRVGGEEGHDLFDVLRFPRLHELVDDRRIAHGSSSARNAHGTARGSGVPGDGSWTTLACGFARCGVGSPDNPWGGETMSGSIVRGRVLASVALCALF